MERALKEVCEAASQHTAARVDVKGSSTIGGVGGVPDTETAGISSQEEVFDEIAFLVDVENPDVPEWDEALESSEHNKWLEGAKAELTSLHDMGMYKVIPCSDVPSNCSVLRGKFVCKLKHDELGNPV